MKAGFIGSLSALREKFFVPGSGQVYHLSNAKPSHTTGASGRCARRSGQAGSSKIGCQLIYLPRKQKSIVPFKASKTDHRIVSPEARTSKTLCKQMGERNDFLTRGLSMGQETFFLVWLPTSGSTPFCPCKTFSCKTCPGKHFLVTVNIFDLSHASYVCENKNKSNG